MVRVTGSYGCCSPFVITRNVLPTSAALEYVTNHGRLGCDELARLRWGSIPRAGSLFTAEKYRGPERRGTLGSVALFAVGSACMSRPPLGLVLFVLVVAFATLVTSTAGAAPENAENAIPHALEDWQAWALKDQEFRRCPFLAGADASNESSHRCAWPERLQLTVDARGGRFAQRWLVYSDSWVALPGDLEHWPQAVELDGKLAPLVSREGVPFVRLTAGSHALSGTWSWDVRPETLSIPRETALLDLSVDGTRVAQPERPDGRVALGEQRSAAEPRQLELQVYRLLEDDEPVRLQTRLRIRAAGDSREESLGRVLPEGFLPLSLASPLPARLGRDGVLRVQVRPGRFELTLLARQAEPAAVFRIPAAGSITHEEVWSFAANDRLRVATVEGVPGIDPTQAQVPDEWKRHPAFRLEANSRLRLTERSRGLSNTDQNRLQLSRTLWLDFDHEGWTVRDELTGTLRRDWRLDLRAPYQLESAQSGSEALLVTQDENSHLSGVEVRSPQLTLSALSRIAHPFTSLPATGWTQSFESVSGRLYLPPGHRLIAVLGADDSPSAWLDRWGLWSLFGVVVVIVFAFWITRRPLVTFLGALGLLLTYQAEPSLIWGWANLLAAIALARAAPAGRLANIALGYRTVSFALLALVLISFAWTEVRQSIYPQLEFASETPQPEYAHRELRTEVLGDQGVPAAVSVAPAPAAPPPYAKSPDEATTAVDNPYSLASSIRGYTSGAPAGGAALDAYAPGTLVQAGPGVPNWDYGAHPFGWSGPVDPNQTVRFIVLGPVEVAVWRIVGVVLLVTFLVQLARASWGPRMTWPGLIGPGSAHAILLLGCVLAVAPPTHAQSLPDAGLLRQLQARLLEPPRCTPTCAELLAAQIRVTGERIETELQASVLASVAIALPTAGDRWQIDSITVDGKSSLAVTREADTGLWMPLEHGVHTVRIEGRLSGENVHLAFPMTPRRITVDAPGWATVGINAGRLLSGALDLTHQRPAQGNALSTSGADGQEFPPFVNMVREFHLGLDWSIMTSVQRVSPSEAAFTIAVPLVPGESVLAEGLQVNPDNTVLVGLSAGEPTRTWNSSLKPGSQFSVRLPVVPARTEVWRFIVTPQWRVRFGGLPATLPEKSNATPWVFEYHPRPGETLDLTVTQPPAVAGRTLAIDRVRQNVRIGRRSIEESVELHYRSTQGGRQNLSLPKDAIVTRVFVDGDSVAIRPEGGQLALSVLPGEHTVGLDLRSNRGESFAARPELIDLHTSASNVQTSLSLSANRWPLFALGKGVGPAFLYWGELLVFMVVAIVLGRLPNSPLRTGEWLLLGLGLSTISWTVLLLVAVWLFAMHWRERSTASQVLTPRQFNARQVALAALTFVAVTSLVFSGVRYGLLATPDMGVTGPGSHGSTSTWFAGNTFSWFVDRTSTALPQPTVYSVPMWVYRTIMFAWALWIALALARWLGFAWRAWSSGGYWRAAQNIPRNPTIGGAAA
jgi:hypothetical protein